MSNSPYKHHFTRYNKINKIKGNYPQKGGYLRVINITSNNVMGHNIRDEFTTNSPPKPNFT